MTDKILFIFYLIVTLLFCVGIILSFYSLSYYGYYSDKIINWIWLIFSLSIIFRFWNRKLIKFFFISLIAIILLSIIPMAIPFFGIVNYFSTIGDYQRIQLNSKYRIERTRQQILSLQRIYVYEKKGLFEQNICRPVYSDIVNELLRINTDSLPIENAKLIKVNKNEIEIEYQISNKKKRLNHELNANDGY